MCQPPTGQMVFSNVSNENVHGLNLPSLDTMYQKKKKTKIPSIILENWIIIYKREKRKKTKCSRYFSMRVLASPKNWIFMNLSRTLKRSSSLTICLSRKRRIKCSLDSIFSENCIQSCLYCFIPISIHSVTFILYICFRVQKLYWVTFYLWHEGLRIISWEKSYWVT